MPKIGSNGSSGGISLDTEVTGLDLYHGSATYLVTICNEGGENTCWETDVDPLTRKPIWDRSDILEIRRAVDQAEYVAMQNSAYDVRALRTIDVVSDEWEWPWDKTVDTLFADHLLASNCKHDLTSQALRYLSVDVKPYDDRVKKATNAALRLIKKHLPDWKIARVGDPSMPSMKGSAWKSDMWVLRALLEYILGDLRFDLLLDDPQLPIVGRVQNCDVRIDRKTKWGNPFVLGKDGDREVVIRKYIEYIRESNLLDDLPELYGKTIGCHCNPKLCHGDILRVLCHPWWSITSDYANSDSAVTIGVWLKQREMIEKRKLDKIYAERLKLLPIVVKMEDVGVTINKDRLDELTKEYKEESEIAGKVCTNIANDFDYELVLPKSGNNKSLTQFVFGSDGMKLPVVKKSKKTGEPSLDKTVMETYQSTLEERSRELSFINNLAAKRKRDTALAYLEGYQQYWLPVSVDSNGAGWYKLHPSLNPTGTAHLRWSSSNPNEQNISKKEGFNLRYCFGPSPGREWWSCDANNIELRIPAYESGEPAMIAIFERPNDPPYYGSYHMLVFDLLHPEKFAKYGMECKKRYASTWYQWVKNFNFADQYGAIMLDDGEGTADRAAHVPGAQRIIAGRLTEKAKLNQYWIDYANQHGYVETMPDKTVDPDRGYPIVCGVNKYGKVKETLPLNYHVSGTAMQWMCKAMVRCQNFLIQFNSCGELEEKALRRLADKLRGKGCYLIGQIHDELVFDLPFNPDHRNLPIVKELTRLMALGGDDIGLPTPVSCEYHDKCWSEGVSM